MTVDDLKLDDRCRTVLETIGEGFFEVDLTGRFTFVNSAMARIVDLPVEQILDIEDRDYLDPESARAVFGVFNEVYRTGTPSRFGPMLVQLKTGSARWVEFFVSLVRDESGRAMGFRGLVHDVTESKRTELALRETNAQFLSLFESIPDIVYFKDVEGRHLMINKAFETSFHLSPAQVIGRTDGEILPPDLAASCRAGDQLVLTGGRPRRFEECTRGPDDRSLSFETIKSPIVDEAGRVLGLVGVSRDITERKKMEDALQASEAEFRRLFDNIIDGVYQSRPDGRIVRANRAYLQMFRLDFEDDLRTIDVRSQYVDPSDRDRFIEQIRRDGEARNRELHLRRRDGTEFYVLANARCVPGENGEVLFEGVLTDITAQKEAQRTLAAALAERDVLLKEIHHRVKNNMQIISSLLSLQSRFLKDAEDVEIFRESQRRIRSMALIHEKLYHSESLSRIEFGGYIRGLVRDLFHSHQNDGGRVAPRLELEEVFLDIQTAIPCGLIVNELVSNALAHAFPDGRRGEIAVALKVGEGGEIALAVKDDGIGLPAEVGPGSENTMGMQLLAMLVQQVEGRAAWDRSRGTEFRMLFKELRYKPRL